MKGCLAVVGGLVVLVILVVVGFGGYFAKKAYDFGKEIEAAFTQLEATDSDFPFVAPANSKLDPQRLDAVLAARDRVARSSSEMLSKFEKMERDGNMEGFMDAMKEMMGSMKKMPADLEAELRAIKMSYKEYVWTVDTAYGTIFAAADQGNPVAVELAKQIEASIVDAKMPGGKSEEKFRTFRDRTKASLVQLDPATCDLVLARGQLMTGDKAYSMFDFMISGKGKDMDFSKN
jgi:hypothetical protein